ncbi:hypothetical protein Tco_0585918 [Tanacetum coccineum]
MKIKKKDQISLDEELAFKLQAEEEEEERLAREKAQREEEANIVAWDNVQAMIDVGSIKWPQTNSSRRKENVKRILVPESQAVNESLESTKTSNTPESSKDSEAESLTPLLPLKNLQGASPSSEVTPLTFQPHFPRERPSLGIVGIKSLLEVTTAKVYVTAAKLKLVLFINSNEKYAK